MLRYLYLALAWLAVTLGLIGAVLPVLPTTPFLLVALWAGSKGSPKFKWWLLRHKVFGPSLIQWYRHGAIAPAAKVLAVSMMSLSWLYVFLKGSHPMVVIFLALLFSGLGVFLCTRPSPQARGSVR